MARAGDPVTEAAGHLLKSFTRPATLLIAISGGSDSTGLLVALATLCATGRYPGITLSACTIDHDLRAGSAEEAGMVAALCKRYAVPHVTRRWDGEKPASGLQAAARARRYDLLVEVAQDIGAEAILSAHTRNDQIETVAMRAERSPEGIGLSGMADAVLLNGSVWLLRPFLDVDRAAIRSFLAARGEGWLDDPSNTNPRFERVRMRQSNAALDAKPVVGDRLALAGQAAAFVAGHIRPQDGCFSLASSAIDIALADPAAWRGLLLLAATVGGRVHTLDAASAGRLRAFLASGTLSRVTAGRVVFDRRREGLHLYRECRGIEPVTISAGATAVWDGRYRIVNRGDPAVVVSAIGNAQQRDARLHGAGLRAARARPWLKFEDGRAAPDDAATLQPVIAPYAGFLPRFDLALANALASMVGCPPFPPPPNE